MAEIEIRCAECDAILEDVNLKTYGRGDSAAIFVNPCKACMQAKFERGLENGLNSIFFRGCE